MDNWISISSNSGSSGTSSVSVTAQTNTGISRTTQVTVTATKFGRTKSATVSVAQITSISGISMTNIVPDSTGGTYVITVSSETPYTVSASDPTWIILSPVSGGTGVTQITVIIPANDTGSGRTGGITATTVGGEYSDDITFTQGAYVDYSGYYFTTRSLENDNAITMSIENISGDGAPEYKIYYSTDDGETWNLYHETYSWTATTTVTASIGEEILWACFGSYYIANPTVSATGNYEVFGNTDSLRFGHDFVNDHTAYTYTIYEVNFINSQTLVSAQNLVIGNVRRFYRMFKGCTSLVSPPQITATTALYSAEMFADCTSLATAPALPATALTTSCYTGMFSGCTSLVNPPALPAPTLADYCYQYMFQGCTSLVTAQPILATTLAGYCCWGMFADCTSLVNAPALPATTLAGWCYCDMFSGCTSLLNAPTLPSLYIETRSYYGMFSGCSSLNYVKCLGIPYNTYATSGWLDGVSSSGTFVKQDIDWSVTRFDNNDGIPSGWTTVYDSEPQSPNYFATKALADNTTIRFRKAVKVGTSLLASVAYSTDGGNSWNQWTCGKSDNGKGFDVASVSGLSNGDVVIWRINAKAIGISGSTSSDYYCGFVANHDIEVYGDIRSLLYAKYYHNYDNVKNEYAFRRLFVNNTYIKNAYNLVLTSNVKKGCYEEMFAGCTGLTSAPDLPATTLANYCYGSMFSGCTSLTTAPAISATTVADGCCSSMFSGCTSLTGSPELPATTLTDSCYYQMFRGCTSLTTAPELPATTLATQCYLRMFYGCTSLNYIKCLATSGINTNYSTSAWVDGVAANGTFVKASGASWPTGTNGIPSGWTVQDAT